MSLYKKVRKFVEKLSEIENIEVESFDSMYGTKGSCYWDLVTSTHTRPKNGKLGDK